MKNDNKQKGFLSPEIVKLSERLAKDPASNLFLSLAEEYVKSGMLEEALVVLTDGLKIHPNFVRARVVLGRVYLDQGQFREAKEQFETVIKESPDNLLAHRKLVKIYREEKEFQKAIESCRVVLSSNPKDEEMKKDLTDLEARQRTAGTVAKTKLEVSSTSPSAPENLSSVLESNVGSSKQDVTVPNPPEGEAGSAIELKEDTSLEEIMNLMGQEGKTEKGGAAVKPPEEELATESLADLYIKQGFYDKGIQIYQALILKEPGNEVLVKKLNDARTGSKSASISPEPLNAQAEVPSKGKGPSIKGGPAIVKEVRGEAASRPPVSATPLPGQQSKAEKIQKLQAWLEQIKRSQKQ